MVVFSGGQGSLKVLPPLVDFIPEARLNLVSDVVVLHGMIAVQYPAPFFKITRPGVFGSERTTNDYSYCE